MSKIVSLLPAMRALPDETPKLLREMADQIEAGEITALAMAYVQNGEYMLTRHSSLESTLVLATLLKDFTIRQFYEQ